MISRMNKLGITCLIIGSLMLPIKSSLADKITLFIPAFDGPDSIGRNVATVLNLRIWSSFRKKPWPHNPKNLDFGKGEVVWDHNSLNAQSHEEAEATAMNSKILAQMVLWGKTYPYGNGFIVQTNMSIPKYNDYRLDNNELWKLKIDDIEIISDIPRRRFEVSSIVLKSEVVERYSLPSSLKLYKARDSNEIIGSVGNSYIGIQLEPKADLAKVITNDTTGWVRLPELSKNPTEVSDFVGGVVKIFRSDWEGAISSMKRVLANNKLKTPLKIDALLYTGLALEKQGKRGTEYFDQAMVLNPYAKRTVIYSIMSELSYLDHLLQSDADTTELNNLLSEIKEKVKNHEKLFSLNDQWLLNTKELIKKVIKKVIKKGSERHFNEVPTSQKKILQAHSADASRTAQLMSNFRCPLSRILTYYKFQSNDCFCGNSGP